MTDDSEQPTSLDILIDQIGRLTEAVTVGFQDFRVELAELTELTERQARVAEQQAEAIERQAKVAEQQAESVARLTSIVEALLRTNGGRLSQ
jgi:methyl-accepting chemotaxis protein